MLVLTLDKFNWGHAVSDKDKSKLALALEETSKSLKFNKERQKVELVVYETPEDYLY